MREKVDSYCCVIVLRVGFFFAPQETTHTHAGLHSAHFSIMFGDKRKDENLKSRPLGKKSWTLKEFLGCFLFQFLGKIRFSSISAWSSSEIASSRDVNFSPQEARQLSPSRSTMRSPARAIETERKWKNVELVSHCGEFPFSTCFLYCLRVAHL